MFDETEIIGGLGNGTLGWDGELAYSFEVMSKVGYSCIFQKLK